MGGRGMRCPAVSEEKSVYAARKTPAGRRPWLRCLHCGRRLIQVDVHDGLTCIRAGMCVVLDAVVVCPDCGQARKFVSVGIVNRAERAIIEGT